MPVIGTWWQVIMRPLDYRLHDKRMAVHVEDHPISYNAGLAINDRDEYVNAASEFA
jgi:hypothetical protein